MDNNKMMYQIHLRIQTGIYSFLINEKLQIREVRFVAWKLIKNINHITKCQFMDSSYEN